jgi:hypothetical protein
MQYIPADGKAGIGPARLRLDIAKLPVDPLRRTVRRDGLAERVAGGMIARHGPNAAREAAVRLNRMIDRGDMPGRDLWACVVRVIHERKAS